MFTLFKKKTPDAPKTAEATAAAEAKAPAQKLSLANLAIAAEAEQVTDRSKEVTETEEAKTTTELDDFEDDDLSLEPIDLDTMLPKSEGETDDEEEPTADNPESSVTPEKEEPKMDSSNNEEEDAAIKSMKKKKKKFRHTKKDQETETESIKESGIIPSEYQVEVPKSLSQELDDLAKLTESFTTLSKDESGILGIFGDEEATEEQSSEDQQTTADTENTDATAKKSAASSKKSEDKNSLLLQLKSVMSQQKTLLQKIAAIGNIPVFDPQKFNQLMEALPAIVAWHKSGGAVPNIPPANTTNATPAVNSNSGATNTTMANGQKVNELSADDLHNEASSGTSNTAHLLAKENEEQIRKNMGIDLEQTTNTTSSKVDAKRLAEEVDSEGFLESTVDMTEEAAPTGAGVTMIGESEAEKESPAEQAKREKIEAAQEKAWAEEAKRRTKELEQKRKEAAKNAKKNQIDGKKFKITAPKKKKVGKLESFMLKLNYFGLSKQRDEFVDNLGVMMDAGLPLLDALKTLEIEAKQKPYKKLLSKVVIGVETGSPLWRAMDSTKFFENQQVSMIKVGEEAGNLVENLRYLGEQSAKQRELKAKVKTAMIYPIIVGVMLTLIIFGLGMFVLPNLIDVIFSLGVPLPFITRMIVAFTGIFSEHGTVLLPSVMGGAIVLLMLHKYTKFKIVTQWIVMKVPGIGVLVNESVLSQFGVTMGGLLQAGVPVTDALESLANTTSIARYQKFYFLLLAQVKLGDSFATSFSKIKMTDKCFPGSMQQLIRTGEKSGSLTKIMLKLAEIHDKKATDVAEKLPVILEPMLLLFIGSLVGTIALGVLAPIYSIVGNVG